MKPPIILIAVFTVSLLTLKLVTGTWNPVFTGNLAMCVMLGFTALGHILFTRGMTLMIPPVIPFKIQLVYFTAVAELAFGLLLLHTNWRCWAGYALIIFFAMLLPANIYAALKHLNIEKGDYNGPGLRYLWFRIPLQLFFIGWVFYFSIWNNCL